MPETYFGNHECLDLSGMGNMWTNTKVDHRTTAVYGGGSTIRDLVLDDIFLKFVVLVWNLAYIKTPEGLSENVH